MPLEIAGRYNEGVCAVARFASALVILPKALRKQIDLVEEKAVFKTLVLYLPNNFHDVSIGKHWSKRTRVSHSSACATDLFGV